MPLLQLRERRQRSWRRERRITTEVPSVCSVGVPSLRSQQHDADTRRQRWQMLTAFAVAGRPYWSGGWQRLPRSASLSGVPPLPTMRWRWAPGERSEPKNFF